MSDDSTTRNTGWKDDLSRFRITDFHLLNTLEEMRSAMLSGFSVEQYVVTGGGCINVTHAIQ